MNRRCVLGIVLSFGALPGAVLAQPARPGQGAQHDLTLGQDFDALPPGARERVQNAFRQGSPDVDDAAIRQRWNAMTPDQRGQTLTARERAQHRATPGPAARTGPRPGAGPGAGPGARPSQAPHHQGRPASVPGSTGGGNAAPGRQGAGAPPHRGTPSR